MIINKDCLEALKELPDNSIDSIVTDPPAGISFMNKSWDDDKGGRDNWIAWMQEIATECHRVLKPGGHGLVWSIPRTSHWTAMAWENAGFEIRDNISHVFGSGFPKSLNIGKAVDRLYGNEREVVAERKFGGRDGNSPTSGASNGGQQGGYNLKDKRTLTKGTSEWEGWGTALKPAREDWWLIRKPIEKGLSIAENCLKWGVGGINIDGSRVESSQEDKDMLDAKSSKNPTGVKSAFGGGIASKAHELGRFPANLVLEDCEEVRECFPESTSGARKAGFTNKETGYEASSYEMRVLWDKDVPAEKGNASRFFKSIIYQAKASKSERNMGLDGFEEVELRGGGGRANDGYDEEDPEQQRLKDAAQAFGAVKAKKANFHPTVKPIKLMEYLVNLVSKPGHTVLDPFAGSGTTGIACKKLNRNFIGIERDEEYCKIATARIESVSQNNTLFV